MNQAPDNHQLVRRYAALFERLQPSLLDELEQMLAPDVHFKDPFNNVIGRAAVRTIFTHMFSSTDAAKFIIEDWICVGQVASIRWKFHCSVEKLVFSISGMSHVRFSAHGLVEEHIDYWDPAADLYEKLPMVRVLLRALRRRFTAVGYQ